MEQLQVVKTEQAPAAIGPYSQAIAVGNMVYTAGQVALDPVTMTLHTGGIEAETERVMQNLRAILHQAGTSLNHVVKTTVFLADMADFAAMNAVYERHFEGHKPARSTVAVSGLPKGARVEIEAVALGR